ncbi:hypothetical protein CLV72_11325 [Allonocardiopsis opalescens]|uniref:Uncharacterized protein n=1 Tax=Allonocardiopsis opalescens TaxID=1144618 RepID=A0A2T0PSH4_9ACTN|nr:hypothetical protein CLV72_11325 [Allonocardiopsis opalescens]
MVKDRLDPWDQGRIRQIRPGRHIPDRRPPQPVAADGQ